MNENVTFERTNGLMGIRKFPATYIMMGRALQGGRVAGARKTCPKSAGRVRGAQYKTTAVAHPPLALAHSLIISPATRHIGGDGGRDDGEI